MPSNRHLEFSDITDFTPGYFDVGDWLVPPTAAQTMTDCHPMIGGGLRAATKPTSFDTTGIVSTGQLAGIFSHWMPSTGGFAADRYLAVQDTATDETKVYRWNACVSSPTHTTPASSWTLIQTCTGSGGNPVRFVTFVDASGQTHVCWFITNGNATYDNVYSLQFSYQYGQGSSAIDDLGNTAVRSVTARGTAGWHTTAIAVQDDRLIVAIGNKTSALQWTDSQSISTLTTAANNLPLQVSRDGSTVTSITPMAPSDLFVSTVFSPWTMVQGDITDPIVRTMSNSKVVGPDSQHPPHTPAGLAFVSRNVGIYATGDGEQFTALSEQIDADTWTDDSNNGSLGVGTVSFGGNYLLAPHGLMYDFLTNSWFKVGVLATGDHYHSYFDQFYQEFFVGTKGSAFSLYTWDIFETTRYNTYTWKSAPLRRPDGRQVEVREVQVYARTYDNNATITVTVNGTSNVVTCATAGKQQLTFLFSQRAEVLDVQVVPAAASASVEAPSIEVVRIGTQSRHTLL